MSDLFAAPGRDDQFSPAENEGRLLLIKPLQHITGINTANGVKDAIEADVHVLDGPQAGTLLSRSYIFPLVLQGQIRGSIGSDKLPVLGRLGKRAAQPGKNAAWELRTATDADKDLARRYLASDLYKTGIIPGTRTADGGTHGTAPAATPAEDTDCPF